MSLQVLDTYYRPCVPLPSDCSGVFGNAAVACIKWISTLFVKNCYVIKLKIRYSKVICQMLNLRREKISGSSQIQWRRRHSLFTSRGILDVSTFVMKLHYYQNNYYHCVVLIFSATGWEVIGADWVIRIYRVPDKYPQNKFTPGSSGNERMVQKGGYSRSAGLISGISLCRGLASFMAPSGTWDTDRAGSCFSIHISSLIKQIFFNAYSK